MAKYPRFTAAEELELHARMVAGDKEAKDLLARSVIPWAFKVARRYTLPEDDVEDVVFISVAQALNRWQPERGRLITTVPWAVRANVSRQLAMMSGVGTVPVTHLFNREKTPERHALALSFFRNRVSIGDLLAAEEPEDDDQLNQWRLKLRWTIARIRHPRKRIILEMRWLEHLTMKQISEVLGVSKARIGQLEKKAKEEFFWLLRNCPEPSDEDVQKFCEHKLQSL